MTGRQRLFASILALLCVLIVGTLGYWLLGDDVTIGAAAFMTLITVSTVGLGEVWQLDGGDRIWTAILIVLGILVVAVAFASLQAMIVGGELRSVLGRRKLDDHISKLSGHFVVCGYGRMGRQVAQGLVKKAKTVVVIDCDPDRTVIADEDGTDYVLGDAADEEVLLHAGLERAAGVIAVLGSDAHNVYVTLTATGIRPDIPVIARAEDPASESKLVRAGASRVISPHTIGANRIVNLLVRPNVAHIVDAVASGSDWEVEEFTLGAGSGFVGKSLREMNLRQRCNALVFAIRRQAGDVKFNPDPNTILQEGDVLVVIGPVGVADTLAGIGAEGP